jgi:hypothetical protein
VYLISDEAICINCSHTLSGNRKYWLSIVETTQKPMLMSSLAFPRLRIKFQASMQQEIISPVQRLILTIFYYDLAIFRRSEKAIID